MSEQLSFFPPFSMSTFDAPRNDDYRKLPRRSSRREAVLRLVINAKTKGRTDEELHDRLAMSYQQVQRARVELLEGGFIQDSTLRRHTRFGDPSIVWRATQSCQEQWKAAGRR